ncbi:MAG TPA: cytochrome c oxidase assembly factor 1 family protein [Chthoniobacterales bacterium]
MDPLPPQSTPSPVTPRRSWWSRNWKWFVPTGCLTIVLAGVVFVCAIVFLVFGIIKSSDVYKTSLARAKNDPAVIEALGTPVKEGMFVSGNTHVEGPAGDANISIPISGPKGKGTVYAVATKSAGRWTYTTLEVEVHGRPDRIDLVRNTTAQP